MELAIEHGLVAGELEEIVEVTRAAVKMGVTKVRLTGGEPLVRHGIVKLVRAIRKIDGIKDFAMTTNAILLAQYAEELADAGLERVNISLDTMDAGRYRQLTRYGDIKSVFAGIEAAQKAGPCPVTDQGRSTRRDSFRTAGSHSLQDLKNLEQTITSC